LLDGSAVKEFLKAAGVDGKVSNALQLSSQRSQGVAALNELSAYAKSEGMTIQITDVVQINKLGTKFEI
jgi:uncharacterized protein YggE